MFSFFMSVVSCFFVTVAARILQKSLYVSAHKTLQGKSCVSCVKGCLFDVVQYGYKKTARGGVQRPGWGGVKKQGRVSKIRGGVKKAGYQVYPHFGKRTWVENALLQL